MALGSDAVNSLTADTMTDVYQAGSGNVGIVIGLIVCNNDPADPAILDIVKTDSSNTILAKITPDDYSLASKQGLHIDTKIVLTNQQKIRIQSNKAAVSVLVSYDESAVV